MQNEYQTDHRTFEPHAPRGRPHPQSTPAPTCNGARASPAPREAPSSVRRRGLGSARTGSPHTRPRCARPELDAARGFARQARRPGERVCPAHVTGRQPDRRSTQLSAASDANSSGSGVSLVIVGGPTRRKREVCAHCSGRASSHSSCASVGAWIGRNADSRRRRLAG
jgi:hypothetical protein